MRRGHPPAGGVGDGGGETDGLALGVADGLAVGVDSGLGGAPLTTETDAGDPQPANTAAAATTAPAHSADRRHPRDIALTGDSPALTCQVAVCISSE